MSWKSFTSLKEEDVERLLSNSDWLLEQLSAIIYMKKRLGGQLTNQYYREIKDRWAIVKFDAKLTSLPDLLLLRDIKRNLNEILFSWYLVKRLIILRNNVNDQGTRIYNEEYNNTTIKREKAIYRWKKRNLDSILIDNPLSIYRTWSADLIDDLNEIDRETIRYRRRKYIALLKKIEKKMQTLIIF